MLSNDDGRGKIAGQIPDEPAQRLDATGGRPDHDQLRKAVVLFRFVQGLTRSPRENTSWDYGLYRLNSAYAAILVIATNRLWCFVIPRSMRKSDRR